VTLDDNDVNPDKLVQSDEKQIRSDLDHVPRKFGVNQILASVWVLAAIILSILASSLLKGTFPIFTFIMLATILVVLLRKRDAAQIGFRVIRWGDLVKYTLMSLSASLFLMAIFEPWSHTYQMLFTKAVSSTRPDTTFGWLVQFPGLAGWLGFILYAGFVTLFAEEFFFRGWLLNWLKRGMNDGKAILWQSVLFTLPQLLAAFFLPPTQGILYAVVYSWLAIGLINGWVASRTRSIWPSLVSATLYNLVMCVLSISQIQ